MNFLYYVPSKDFQWQAHYMPLGSVTLIPEHKAVGNKIGVLLTYDRVEKLLVFISRKYDEKIAEMLEVYGVLSRLEK